MNIKKANLPDSKIKKFLTILLTSLILLIPTGFISDIISNRIQYKSKADENVAKSWANAQTIQAPRMYFFDKNKVCEFDLDNYETSINIETQTKKKGVFNVPVYVATVTQKGTFSNSFKDLSNKQIYTKIQISDSRGYIDEPLFNINNSGFKGNSDSIYQNKIDVFNKKIPFEITYKIKGLNDINVGLGGKKNNIIIEGNWKDPSFGGDFLPIESKITDKNFSAKWYIPQIATSKENSTINVSLLISNDNYSLAEKSLKYAFLLLSLIFTGYFIFEITSKENKKIHPFQYCLLGVAMLMFYLLLVSMSEIIPFNFAYFISALMVVGLIFAYTYFVITNKKDFKFSLGITTLIGLLYLFFFVLLKLQDVALLSGSIGLFVIIALVMYLTRNVNWYSENFD